jgi:hypothetical protein
VKGWAVTAAYLETARKAGLLAFLNDRPYVAGVYRDQISGVEECLVEYCDPSILQSRESFRELFIQLTDQFEAADRLTLRVRDEKDLPEPWAHAVSYLRYRPDMSGQEQREAGIHDPYVIVEGTTETHSHYIEHCLLKALRDGYVCQSRPVNEHAALAAVRDVMQTAGRSSYVAIVNDEIVGHATMITTAHDEITGENYVDLVDILVDPGDFKNQVREALLAAAAEKAKTEGKALIGNVTHPAEEINPDEGSRIVNSLLLKGWEVDYVDWLWTRS